MVTVASKNVFPDPCKSLVSFHKIVSSLMSGISLFVFHSRNTNKGIGIEVIHFLNDGLWQMKQLEK